jgi:hypothetical protein
MDVHREKQMIDGLVSTHCHYSTLKKSAVARINKLSSSHDDHYE